jgi:uncharacterized protein (DUF4415 family)
MISPAKKSKTMRTASRTRSKGATGFKRLRAMRGSEIDFSDIPKLDKSFWATAKLTLPERKDRLTIRVDRDVVRWLKKHGKGYQTRINAILRSYMEAQGERRWLKAGPAPLVTQATSGVASAPSLQSVSKESKSIGIHSE